MKKRLISALLTVCMIVVLFSGFSVNAAADNDTVQHTLQRGETVIGVCQTLGIDFHANYRWITETNHITNYGNLKPGMVLTLPAPGTIAGAKTVAAPADGGAAGAAGGVSKGLLPGDYVTSYLIPHVMQRGETVGGVCSALGIDFNSNAAQIQRLNNIKDFRRIFVGRTIYLPISQPKADGPCVALVAHKVVAGDAMYNICKSYGLDYAGSLKMLQMLNGREDNFSNIKVGQTILLPVSTVYTQNPGGTTPGTTPGGNTPGGTVTPGGNKPSDGGAGSNSDGKTYRITALTTNHGSFKVQVNGKNASEAKSGSTVTVEATPAWDHQLGYITVTNSSGKTVATVTDGKFTMPNCDVRVSVTFVSKDEYKVFRGKAVNGQFEVRVNGLAVDQAAAGQILTVYPEAAYGYELDKITVSYNKGKDFVSVKGDGSFIMPECNVKVDVTFKRAAAHAINQPVDVNGSYECQINGRPVSEAHSGETVKIVARPHSGYKYAGASVKDANGYSIPVNGNSFVMPAGPVTVNVSFSTEAYNVKIEQTPNGTVYVDRTTAAAGDTVTVTYQPGPNAVIQNVTFDGESAVKGSNSYSFVMPAHDVTVRGQFALKTGQVMTYVNGGGTASSSNANPQVGETVSINYEANKGCRFVKITATTASGQSLKVNGNKFVMPAENVSVTVYFEAIKYNITVVSGANGTAKTDKISAVWGDTVSITSIPYNNAQVGSITVTDANGNNIPVSSNSFEMPCADVTVNVQFVSFSTYEIKGNRNPNGGSYCTTVDDAIVTKAEAGQTVKIKFLPSYGYELDHVTVNAGGSSITVSKLSDDTYSFVMPAQPVKIELIFKEAGT